MKPVSSALFVIAGLACAAALWPSHAAGDAGGTTKLSSAQSDYVEYCAGCHGIQGRSAPANVPELRGRVGHFLCTPSGRDYIIRLPNVALAPIADDQQLADLMNFVVFGLGGASAPQGAKPYSRDEVAALRARPLSGKSLIRERAQIVAALVKQCGAPSSLRSFYAGGPIAPSH